MKNHSIHALSALLLLPLSLLGQPDSYKGGLLVQSFNNPAFNSKGNTSAAWTNAETVEGWYSSATQITYGWAGAATSARMFGYRFDSSGDSSPVAGALGSRTSAATGPIHYAWALRNDSGQAIDQLVLAFRAFVANSETDPDKADRLSFSYKIGGGFEGDGYIAVAELNYNYAGGNARGNPVAGTTEALSTAIGNLNWQAGQTLWLRWTDEHSDEFGGVAMGIDHLHVRSDVSRVEYYTEWQWQEADVTNIYHVDREAANAADTNSGSIDSPLQTIQAAVLLAQQDSAAGRGSQVIIHPGIYRELIDITSRSGNLPLTIEAAEPGTVTISGSDIFNNWQPVQGMPDVYSHHWPYKFGWEPNPWPGDLALRYPEGTRRELLFVNKMPITQVVQLDELAENTYIVDEDNERILFFPAFGVDPNAMLTEVSVRPQELYGENSKVLRVYRVNNIRIRGLRFEHAAAATLANDSAVAIRGCSNVIVEDLVVEFNNGFGLSISEQGETPASNVVVRNVVVNYNGALGMTTGAISNVHMSNVEASYNNWRGALWGATGWAPCGFKFAFLNGAVLSDFRLTQNHSTGGWMDAGNADVLIERFYSVNNFRAGLSLEANFGPIVVRDSVFYGNTTGINGFDNSNVRIENSLIFGNSTGQIRMAGSTSLTPEELAEIEEDWAIDRQSRRHIPRNWTIVDSYVGALSPGNPYFFGIDVRGGTLIDEHGQPRYQDFPDTFLSSNTDYFNPAGSNYPGFPNLLGQPIAFDEWETLYTTGDMGNAFVSHAEAEAYHLAGIELAGHPMTGFTGAIASAPVVQVEALDRFAFESGPVGATFRISRSEGDTSGPLLVIFRFTGAAQAGVDFVDPGDRIQIESGEDYADVQIMPISDGVVEFAEDLVLELQPDLDGLYRLTGTRVASIRLIDEDAVNPARIQVVQPSSGTIDTVNLSISNPLNSTVSLTAPTFDKRYSAVSSRDLDGPAHVADSIAPVGQAVAFNWLVTNRDGVSGAIPLGFPFPFFGQQFANVYVHSNGFVSFSPPDASRSYSSHIELPSDHANANPNTIAGFWSNLTMVADSRVWTRAETGRFIIEYHEMNRFPAFGSPQRVSFQIILSANGKVDLVYLKNTFSAPNQSIGLQGPTPNEGISLSFNDNAVRVPSTVRLMSASSWLDIAADAFAINGLSSASIDISLQGSGLLQGNYSTTVEIFEDGSDSLVYVVPVELTVGDLLADAMAEAGDWKYLAELGWSYTEFHPWIYSGAVGWAYLASSSLSNVLLWHPQAGWVWSHHKAMPWAWQFSTGLWVPIHELP